MVVGVGAGDFIAIPTLAWKVYRMCKDSSDEFKRIAAQLESLHTALLETQEQLEEDVQLTGTRQDRFAKLKASIVEILKELQALLDQYESMSTPAQKAWDKLRWAAEDVASIRLRIIGATTELQSLNQQIHNSSLRTINKKLDRFMRDHRAGHREGSCVSVQTVESIYTMETWRDLRRELEDVGITTAAITENREYIISWFQNAIGNGLLQEQDPSADPPVNPLSPWSTSLTPADTNSTDGQGRKQSEGTVSYTSTVSQSEGSTGRRKSRFGTAVFKIFRSDLPLLEAASNGDVKRVDELISKGANVNVKDRWGWRPLSMAAYGGTSSHEEIARMLVNAGADLDYKDVDGDSPLDLATNKGHTSLVLLIEEAIQERARNEVS